MKSTKKDWLIPAGLVALSLVPAVAGIARLAQLAGGGNGAVITEQNARFFASPLPALIHIPSVIVYSLLGALQFSPSFRRNRRGWHRAAGKILIPAGLLVAMSGLWMAQFYP